MVEGREVEGALHAGVLDGSCLHSHPVLQS